METMPGGYLLIAAWKRRKCLGYRQWLTTVMWR